MPITYYWCTLIVGIIRNDSSGLFGLVVRRHSYLVFYWSDCDKFGISLKIKYHSVRSVRVAERLALPTSDHGVAGSNPAGGEILPEPKRRFIAQSLSCSPSHRLEMTEILLKGRKTLTHPSIILLDYFKKNLKSAFFDVSFYF